MIRFALIALVGLITTAQAQPLLYPKPQGQQCAGAYDLNI